MKKYLFVPLVISALMLSACTARSANRGPSPQPIISTTENVSEPAIEYDTPNDGEEPASEPDALYVSISEEPPVEPDVPPEETSDEVSVSADTPMVDTPMRENPPELTARTGDNSVVMARNGYTWQTVDGDEVWDTIACGDTAYSACMNGAAPKLSLAGADTVQIDLPDNSEISGAYLEVNEDESELLDTDGGVITLPALSDGANAFSINIKFAEGECEYVFCGVN